MATLVDRTKDGKPKTIEIIIEESLKENPSLQKDIDKLDELSPMMKTLLLILRTHIEKREKEIDLLERKYENLDGDLNTFKAEIIRRDQATQIVEMKRVSISPPPIGK